MGITRPTGEQLRFRSQYTGDHVLDAYLESSEKGGRSVPDLLDDIFDSSGVFRDENFEFRFDATTDKIQFRVGNFASSTTGWTDITTFFKITGTFNAATTYQNFDLATTSAKDVYFVHGLSSGTTFANEAAFIASSNTTRIVDVSEARDWAKKTDGIVDSTDYSSKAWAIGGTGVTNSATGGAAKEWAIKTSGTVDGTNYSAKYWATHPDVIDVATHIADVSTVANNIVNVVHVGAYISNVNTVATNIADINAVVADATDIGTVSTNISDVNTVAGISANVTTVASNISNISAVVADATDIGTVATNIASVNTVATNIDDVITVANDLNEAISEIETAANDLNEAVSEIDTVSASISNVNIVGTNISHVNTVAGINAAISTVSGIALNVSTIANNLTNVTTVAGISSDVTTVASNMSSINDAVSNMSAINSAATNAMAAYNSANTAAQTLDTFEDIFLGVKSSAPSVDNDGDTLQDGAIYFDSSNDTLYVYRSSIWRAIDDLNQQVISNYTFTASANQTSFGTTDDNSNTVSINTSAVTVYLNGVKLVPTNDYTPYTQSIVLTEAALAGDVLEVVTFEKFSPVQHIAFNQLTGVNLLRTSGFTNSIDVMGIDGNGNVVSQAANVGSPVKLNAGNAVQVGSWLFDATGTSLLIKYGSTTVMKVTSSGDVEFAGNVTANATIT